MSKSYRTSFHDTVNTLEENHFWFLGRNRMLDALITRFFPHRKGKTFLEIGCGTGMVLSLLDRLGFRATGLDINARALLFARKKTRAELIRSSFFSFSTSKKYDAVGIFDVLEHQQDDRKFLRLCFRMLRPGGFLFLTVPSGMWLWNRIDVISGHVRRYEKNELIEKLEHAGFRISFVNYWNILLLPWYILWRFIFLRTTSRKRMHEQYPKMPVPFMNRLCGRILLLEDSLFFRVRIPVGTSLIVVARRKD